MDANPLGKNRSMLSSPDSSPDDMPKKGATALPPIGAMPKLQNQKQQPFDKKQDAVAVAENTNR